MGTKLTGQGYQSKPVVSIKEIVGSVFQGVLKSPGKAVKLRRGTGFVYEFAVLNTDMPTQIKNASGKYVDEDVAEGDIVSIFAPTMLHGVLSETNVGDVITIKYLGTAPGKKGDYHNFDVEKE